MGTMHTDHHRERGQEVTDSLEGIQPDDGATVGRALISVALTGGPFLFDVVERHTKPRSGVQL